MSPGRKRNAHNVSEVDPASFGAQLRKYREEAGISQEELGERSGVGQPRISTYERNVSNPTEDIIVALAEALNVAPSVFFEASQFNGVLVVGQEVRDKLKRLEPAELRMLDHVLDAIDSDDPKVRERFERGFRHFLDSLQLNGC